MTRPAYTICNQKPSKWRERFWRRPALRAGLRGAAALQNTTDSRSETLCIELVSVFTEQASIPSRSTEPLCGNLITVFRRRLPPPRRDAHRPPGTPTLTPSRSPAPKSAADG
jgi:hypothetical protein